jgi:COP9 signalosome complex subunit 2
MYKITLEALKKANNERLWFTTNLKLAKVYLDIQNFPELENLLLQLKKSCQLTDGSDDPTKGTYLLEVYCLEIQLCSLTQNSNRMRVIYPRTLNLNAAVSDPRIMGIIREEGGKMYLLEGLWLEAYNELFESFRAYQQAGNIRAKICLKYVVLASMLALSDINPFSAREAKVYADDLEIIAMSDLRNCLEINNLKKFEQIIKDKRNKICDEPLLMTYIGSLRNRMRERVSSDYCPDPFSDLSLCLSLSVSVCLSVCLGPVEYLQAISKGDTVTSW